MAELVERVKSYDAIPQMWRDGKIILEDTLYSNANNWDTRAVTFERKLSSHERKVNYVWGSIWFILTLGNIFNFEKIDHLLHDTKERKQFDITLKGQIHGKKVPVARAG
jgi:hypothetical protein